jgi:hypothetical protein
MPAAETMAARLQDPRVRSWLLDYHAEVTAHLGELARALAQADPEAFWDAAAPIAPAAAAAGPGPAGAGRSCPRTTGHPEGPAELIQEEPCDCLESAAVELT